MLLWQNLFCLFIFLTLWSFFLSSSSLYFLLFNGEFIVILIFCLLVSSGLMYGSYIFLGLGYLFLIFAGLELALNILLMLI